MYSPQKVIRILSSTFSDLPDLSQAKIRGLDGLRKVSPYLHPDEESSKFNRWSNTYFIEDL